tara:strand:+ start:2776 stop:3063 length:288 start_codon:yes stop_codon:yes gene_type:complete
MRRGAPTPPALVFCLFPTRVILLFSFGFGTGNHPQHLLDPGVRLRQQRQVRVEHLLRGEVRDVRYYEQGGGYLQRAAHLIRITPTQVARRRSARD